MNPRIEALLNPKGDQALMPAAFFLHFAAEFHGGAAAVDKHLEFLRFTGMDILKVQLELPFPDADPNRPESWADAARFPAETYADQVQVVEMLVRAAGEGVPVVVTLYSSFMCAERIVGRQPFIEYIDRNPDGGAKIVEASEESLRGFVQACIRVGVSGFYMSSQGGEDRRFSTPDAFKTAGEPSDLRIMREIDVRCPFNILHICDSHADLFGGYGDLSRFAHYPGQVVSAPLGGLTPTEVSKIFGGRPFFGGLDRLGPLATGSMDDVRTAALEALEKRSPRFMLGADCTVPGKAPWENLREAVRTAHEYQG